LIYSRSAQDFWSFFYLKHFLTSVCWHNYNKGPSIKNIRRKSRKIDPLPLVRKMPALAQSLPPCLCGKDFEISKP